MSDVHAPEEDEESTAFLPGRKVITVGGGKGGVGKSLIAANVGVYLAQLGKSVLLVDADPSGGNLHAQLGARAAAGDPPIEPNASDRFRAAIVSTLVPGLFLLPAPHDSIEPSTTLRASRKGKWLARVREQPYDFIVVDAGPGHGKVAIDLMLAADAAILVAVPEPPAIEAAYRFAKASFLRRLERALLQDRFRLPILHRALVEIGRLPAPLELARRLETLDKALAELAWSEAQRLRLELVVNRTRMRGDMDLGAAMVTLGARHLGLPLEDLGHVEEEDSVWLSIRRGKPLLVDSPTSKAGRNVERIARRVLALLSAKIEATAGPSPLPSEKGTLYAALGVPPSSSDEEIRRAYKRQKEMYGEQSLGAMSLLLAGERRAELVRIDEAFDTLLDPVRRRAYDLSTFPDSPPLERGKSVRPPPLVLEQRMLQSELLRELGPDTEFTGALLRRVRESVGIEMDDIAQRSKISKVYLVAIEEEAYETLPAEVYVRGFLTELAKTLGLDASHVAKSYLQRMRRRMGDLPS